MMIFMCSCILFSRFKGYLYNFHEKYFYHKGQGLNNNLLNNSMITFFIWPPLWVIWGYRQSFQYLTPQHLFNNHLVNCLAQYAQCPSSAYSGSNSSVGNRKGAQDCPRGSSRQQTAYRAIQVPDIYQMDLNVF